MKLRTLNTDFDTSIEFPTTKGYTFDKGFNQFPPRGVDTTYQYLTNDRVKLNEWYSVSYNKATIKHQDLKTNARLLELVGQFKAENPRQSEEAIEFLYKLLVIMVSHVNLPAMITVYGKEKYKTKAMRWIANQSLGRYLMGFGTGEGNEPRLKAIASLGLCDLKGWSLTTSESKMTTNDNGYTLEAIHKKTGEIRYYYTRSDLISDLDIDKGNLSNVLSGKRKSINGYIIKEL